MTRPYYWAPALFTLRITTSWLFLRTVLTVAPCFEIRLLAYHPLITSLFVGGDDDVNDDEEEDYDNDGDDDGGDDDDDDDDDDDEDEKREDRRGGGEEIQNNLISLMSWKTPLIKVMG